MRFSLSKSNSSIVTSISTKFHFLWGRSALSSSKLRKPVTRSGVLKLQFLPNATLNRSMGRFTSINSSASNAKIVQSSPPENKTPIRQWSQSARSEMHNLQNFGRFNTRFLTDVRNNLHKLSTFLLQTSVVRRFSKHVSPSKDRICSTSFKSYEVGSRNNVFVSNGKCCTKLISTPKNVWSSLNFVVKLSLRCCQGYNTNSPLCKFKLNNPMAGNSMQLQSAFFEATLVNKRDPVFLPIIKLLRPRMSRP